MEQSCTCDVPMDSGGPPAVDAGAMFRPEEGCDGGRDTAVNEPRPAAPPGGAAGMAPEMQAVAGPYDGAPQYMPGGQVAPAPQYGYAGFPPAPQYGYAGFQPGPYPGMYPGAYPGPVQMNMQPNMQPGAGPGMAASGTFPGCAQGPGPVVPPGPVPFSHPGEYAGLPPGYVPNSAPVMPSPAAGNAPGDGPGGFAPGYAPAPETAAHGGPPAHVQHPKHDAHMYGQLLQMAEKFANGEANIADVVNGISLLERTDSQFWRGLLAGGVATMLLASGPVRESLAGIFNRPGAGAVAANNDNRETVEENS